MICRCGRKTRKLLVMLTFEEAVERLAGSKWGWDGGLPLARLGEPLHYQGLLIKELITWK